MWPKQRHLLAGQFGRELVSPLADGGPRQARMLRPRLPRLDQTDRHQHRSLLTEQIVDRAVVELIEINPIKNVLPQPLILLPREPIRHQVGAIADHVHTLDCFRFRVSRFSFHLSHLSPFTFNVLREGDAQLVIAARAVARHEKI